MTSRIQTVYAPNYGEDILSSFGAGIANFVSLFALWSNRAHQRHHLVGLDDRMLQDIGVSRGAPTTKPPSASGKSSLSLPPSAFAPRLESASARPMVGKWRSEWTRDSTTSRRH